MTLTSKTLAAILFFLIFGGIAISSAIGWWVTESTRVPVTFTEGEFAGQANPADIRGSFTFGDIAKSFDVTPEVLAQAFGIQEGDPAAFVVKDLEDIYADSGYEIGTTSVRLFVAYYTGSPFGTTDQGIYLPKSAANILLEKGDLTTERIAYLEKYTVDVSGVDSGNQTTNVSVEATTSEQYLVKGKTTFGELTTWGVSRDVIEKLIGAPIPDAAMALKDYAFASGLNFETLRPALQAEVDRVKP